MNLFFNSDSIAVSDIPKQSDNLAEYIRTLMCL